MSQLRNKRIITQDDLRMLINECNTPTYQTVHVPGLPLVIKLESADGYVSHHILKSDLARFKVKDVAIRIPKNYWNHEVKHFETKITKVTEVLNEKDHVIIPKDEEEIDPVELVNDANEAKAEEDLAVVESETPTEDPIPESEEKTVEEVPEESKVEEPKVEENSKTTKKKSRKRTKKSKDDTQN